MTRPTSPTDSATPTGSGSDPAGTTATPGLGPPATPGVGAALAVDIGGTKVAAGLVDDSGRLLDAASAPTAAAPTGEDLLRTVIGLCHEVRGRHPEVVTTVVGVGSGGPMTLGGAEVSPLNIAVWRDFPLRARLAEEFDLPCFLDNDGKALALAEGWRGAAVGVDDYLAMVVSTGVGGGVVVGGRLLDGASGNAGHIGHVVVEPEGRPCACGGRGCLEAHASGTAIAAITGAPASHADIGTRRRVGELVGRAVASVVHLLDIRLAAVAGSVALGFGEVFFAAAQAELVARAGLRFAEGARIVPAGCGADGPLIGAAAVGFTGLTGSRPR